MKSELRARSLKRAKARARLFNKYQVDGFIDKCGYKRFLVDINVWGKGTYHDKAWDDVWVKECKILRQLASTDYANSECGINLKEFESMYVTCVLPISSMSRTLPILRVNLMLSPFYRTIQNTRVLTCLVCTHDFEVFDCCGDEAAAYEDQTFNVTQCLFSWTLMETSQTLLTLVAV